MSNFELNSQACALSDSRSGYSLAREVLELREDRDAMAAHVERLNRILFDTYAAIDADDVHALPYDEYRDAYNDAPQISLAQRDARMKAEVPHESP